MARKTFYSQAQCSVVDDGIPVTDFADGDSIRIIDDAVGATKTQGLDGVSLSFASDESGFFEFDLKPTSPHLDIVSRRKRAQARGQARVFNVTVATGVGEFIRLEGCAVEKAGDVPAGGNVMAKRTVRYVVSRIVR